jgi:membrane protein
LKYFANLASAVRRMVWGPDLGTLPRWHALLLRYLRIIHAVIRELGSGQPTLRAMSLVYTTLLSLVPLIAVSFSVLKGLGVHYQIEPLLLGALEPLGDKGVEITERIIGYVSNIRADVLGTVGLAFLVFTVISLIQKIEAAFNASWRVAASRSLGQRFSNYLSVILVGPLLLVSALGITATVTHSRQAAEVAVLLGPVLDHVARVVPYLMVIAAFSFIYLLVPNTRVRFRSALFGAVVAGLLWESAGWAFTSFVTGSNNYTAIYSAFAAVILFMIWLFVSWLIVLTGSTFAFYHQHPEYLAHGPDSPDLSIRQRERYALALLYLMAQRFLRGQPPCPPSWFATRLGLPETVVWALLEPLEQGGFITRTADDPSGFMPARDLARIAISEVLDLVRASGEVLRPGSMRDVGLEAVDALLRARDTAVGTELAGITLVDLCATDAGETPQAVPPTRRTG